MTDTQNGGVLMDAAAIEKALVRISHEIFEKNGQQAAAIVLLGIPARGDTIAQRIAIFLKRDHGVEAPVGVLDITLHRDDVGTKPSLPKVTQIPGSMEGKIVVLVDDVLYTGRSVRAAMDALAGYGRPQAIQLAVLVDRGHRELPIRADYVGKNIPTTAAAHVRVQIAEEGGIDQVILEKEG